MLSREPARSAEGSPEHARLVRKLESIVDLDEADREALGRLPLTVRVLPADTDIVRQGDRPSQCCLLLEGLACRYLTTEEGKRQILSFHIPGDIPDLQSLHLKEIDDNLGTLVPSRVAFIAHGALLDLFRERPNLVGVFWRDTLITAAMFRRWILNVGRRDAYGRMAHLLCELVTRLKSVGLADGWSIELPVTQAELGDALGISTVHTNRSLQALRADGLVSLRGGSLTVKDWDGLVRAGEFDPTYLHLARPLRSG